MLEETIAALRGGDLKQRDEQWSPQISLGTPVLIPESYVADLQTRLGLYRRLSTLDRRADIDEFAEELVDRFGELPAEVEHLLDVMEIKALCRHAGIGQIDAGPKGAVITFRGNTFTNPAGLVEMMRKVGGMKLQPDHKLVFKDEEWSDERARMKGVRSLALQLADIARAKQAA
jgi:transcription-repair coupling factor (superfamily II helicase)